MPKTKQLNTTNSPTPIEDPPSFNLWTEPWITVERLAGGVEQLGIAAVLRDAHAYRAIYDPSPLVVVGIQRLLTAILQDALDPQTEDDLHALWRGDRLPVERINQFGERYADRFDLFSPDKPFLQSADLPLTPLRGSKIKSAAVLFAEFPSGTEVTHYYHGVQDEHVFSPASAAAGLVTISAFAMPGGSGIKPSINGVPPIYVLPGGRSLLDSLRAALLIPLFWPPPANRRRDDVWWRRVPLVERSKEVSEVGYLHSLTFPARRVRLHPVHVDAPCTRSGVHTQWGVRTLVFDMGESRPKDAPWWLDPFVAYRWPEAKKPAHRQKPQSSVKQDQPTPIRPQRGLATWREFAGLFMQRDETRRTRRPLFIHQMAELELAQDRTVYPFRCVGVLTDQAKNFEWTDYGFDVPPRLLNDVRGAEQVEKAIQFAGDCSVIMSRIFASQFGGSTKAPRYVTSKQRMLDSYWTSLAGSFRQLILALADEEARAGAFAAWLSEVVRSANAGFATAAAALGDDAANLRRRTQGEQRCARDLYQRLQKETPHE